MCGSTFRNEFQWLGDEGGRYTTLVSLGDNGLLRRQDLKTGEWTPLSVEAKSVAPMPDGRLLVVTENSVYITDENKPVKNEWPGLTFKPRQILVSADGRSAVMRGDTEFARLDLATGDVQYFKGADFGRELSFSGNKDAFAVSADGNTLYESHVKPGDLTAYDLKTRTVKDWQGDLPDWMMGDGLALAPDGSRVVLFGIGNPSNKDSGGFARILDLKNNTWIDLPDLPDESYRKASITADGREVRLMRYNGGIEIWSLETHKLLGEGIVPAGRRVLGFRNNGMCLWLQDNATGNPEVWNIKSPSPAPAPSAPALRVADSFEAWDKLLPSDALHKDPQLSVSSDAHGDRQLIAIHYEKDAFGRRQYMFFLREGQFVRPLQLPAGTTTTNISPDGKKVSIVTRNMLFIMDIESGIQAPIPGPFNDVELHSVEWRPDGKALIASFFTNRMRRAVFDLEKSRWNTFNDVNVNDSVIVGPDELSVVEFTHGKDGLVWPKDPPATPITLPGVVGGNFSPDGSKVIFNIGDETRGIGVIVDRFTGQELTRVDDTWGAFVGNDGSVIKVKSDHGSGKGLVLINAGSKEEQPLLPIDFTEVNWVPDGSALIAHNHSTGEIHTIKFTGAALTVENNNGAVGRIKEHLRYPKEAVEYTLRTVPGAKPLLEKAGLLTPEAGAVEKGNAPEGTAARKAAPDGTPAQKGSPVGGIDLAGAAAVLDVDAPDGAWTVAEPSTPRPVNGLVPELIAIVPIKIISAH